MKVGYTFKTVVMPLVNSKLTLSLLSCFTAPSRYFLYGINQADYFSFCPILNHNFLTSVRGADFDSHQPDTVTDQGNDSFQHWETVVCCYFGCIWRCFLHEIWEAGVHNNLPPGEFSAVLLPLMWASLPLIITFLFVCVFHYTICLSDACLIALPIHGTLCLNFTPSTFHFVSQKDTERYASLCQSKPKFLDICQAMVEKQFALCTNLNRLYPLGIVKGRQKCRDRHGGKYPINLQDISCRASVHTTNDVTLCASMSKCHNKLLHIIQALLSDHIVVCGLCNF